jgi:hypothetical protein
MAPEEVANTLAIHGGLMDTGQILILASLGSMLAAGFVFIIRQIIGLQKLLDERLTRTEYEKRHLDLESRMLIKVNEIEHDYREIYREHGNRLRSIELWAAKKNNPEFK